MGGAAGITPERLPSLCMIGGGGGGIIPASRFLRRRAAAEDLGAAADVDAFWSAAPRLYDFSQQPQQLPAQRPPSPSPPPAVQPRSPSPPPPAAAPPSPAPEQEDPCLLLLRCSPSPRPATPPPPPSPEPECLLTVLRGGVRWGATRSVTYRNRAADGGGKKMKRLEEVVRTEKNGRGKKRARAAVKTEEEEGSRRRLTRSSGLRRLRRRPSGASSSRRAKKKKTPLLDPVKEEEEEEVVKKEKKTRSRKTERTGCGRYAPKRANKTLPPVKEEENEEEKDVIRGNKKRKLPAAAAEASSSRVVKREEEVKVYHRRAKRAARKAPKDEEEGSKPTTAKLAAPKPTSSPTGKVDRWSARRYAAGEAALLSVLRARGAVARHPAPRAELRASARRHIGDTGLLDHLLLHAADKVPAGSADRIRRRYNVDGALEYFLEPAGLKALRREAGVRDPFWVPPPGWKLGDPVSPEDVARKVKKQVEELAAELAVIKREMKKLGSNLVHVSKEAYITWKGYDCMLKANENLGKELLSLEDKYDAAAQVNNELKEELLLLKENYESMAEKNAKLEEQMVDISSCLQFLKDDLPLPDTEGGEQMLMLEPAGHCVKESPTATADIDKQEARADNAPGDVVVGASKVTTSQGSIGDKRMLRKCSMRICKPQGTFQWPNTSAGNGMLTGEAWSPKAVPEPLTPGGDLIVTNLDAVVYNLEEYMATDGLPTPTSASSTTAASTRTPLLPTPTSPLQQLSTTTARHDDLQLQHKDLSSLSSAPCLLEAGKKAPLLGGGNVGTELALATPSY